MKVSPAVAKQIWVPILVQLRREREDYDYRAALEVSRGIRRGYTAGDMLEELEFVVKALETDGLVQPIKQPPQQTMYFGISFPNVQFYFAEKFDREIDIANEVAERRARRQRRWENWIRPFLVSLLGGAIGGVGTWLMIEKALR
jgi:hypothetical protein